VQTVPEAGWAGLKNGELLRVAATSFTVFVTMDQNLQYQQNLKDTALTIVVLESSTNRYADLLPLVPKLLETLQAGASPGAVIRIGA